MTTKSLIEKWLDFLEVCREGPDVPIIHAFVLKDDDSLTMIALAVGPKEAWDIVLQEVGKMDTLELIFGIDRFTKEGQGIDTPSCVTVYHWRRDHDPSFWGYRLGVVPYDETGCRPVIWDHPFWTQLQRAEITHLLEKAQDRTQELLKKLGAPPEVHQKIIDGLVRLPRPVTQETAVAFVRQILAEHRSAH